MSALTSRLDKLAAALKILHPPRELPFFDAAELYGKSSLEQGEELDEADALDRLLSLGKITPEEREQARTGELDIKFIMRVIVDPDPDNTRPITDPVWTGVPADRSFTAMDSLPAEPRKPGDPRIEERSELTYPYRGDGKI
jgi:hypothetical protein